MDTRETDAVLDGAEGRGRAGGAPVVSIGPSLVRDFFLALVLALLGEVIGNWLYQEPVLTLLAYTSVVFVTASMLFGWAGLAAAIVAHFTFVLWRDGSVFLPSLVSYGLAGALAWVVFRYVPRLNRGLSDVRSLGWFVAVTSVGAIVSTGVISGTSGVVSDLFESVLLWSRSTIVTLWVQAPLLLILATQLGHRWLTVIPGEVRPTPPKTVTLDPVSEGTGRGLGVAVIRSREVELLATLGRCFAMVLAITLAKLWLVEEWGPSLVWWSLLYLAPIYWTARQLRLPGGLLSAGLAGFATLASYSFVAPKTGISPEQTLAVYAQLLFFWFVGTLLGWGAEREGRLVEELAASHDRLRLSWERVVRALTGALEAKDEYTEGHLKRVNSYALEVGRRLDLNDRELELLAIAGNLHDMGKIALPESILNKPGPLTEAEKVIMRRHPEIGARILAGVEGLQDAAPLVLHHHERWDGNTDGPHPGYPAGLKGDQIPVGARIIAVVDAFDAMTTTRPYRAALSVERAREVLLEERGRQLDSEVVDAFLELVSERPWMVV